MPLFICIYEDICGLHPHMRPFFERFHATFFSFLLVFGICIDSETWKERWHEVSVCEGHLTCIYVRHSHSVFKFELRG